MTDFKGNELNIGDKVVFCVSVNKLDEGIIVNFYKGQFDHDACTIQTATKKVRNIYSTRIYKLQD